VNEVWTKQTIVAPTQTTPPPFTALTTTFAPLTVYNNNVFMAWKGETNYSLPGAVDDSIWYSTFDGNIWTPQTNLKGYGTTDAPFVTVFKGAQDNRVKIFMAWIGA
jgi:hypothetical protein